MMFKYLFLMFGVVTAFEDKTVVQYLVDNGFTTLASAVQSVGLDVALSSSGPFTVFAPTEAAFTKLGSTLSTLSTSQLELVLKYHVTNGFILGPQISGSQNVTTLNGQSLVATRNGSGIIINGVSMVTGSDIIVNNGVIHVIDTVLIPPVLPTLTITQTLIRDDTRFNDLVLALILADLTSALDVSEYTLFAPIDAAFGVYKDNLLSPNTPNAQMVYQEVLKYHVVPGARMANQLKNGEVLTTLHGTNLTVSLSTGAMVNKANIIDTDILASNGVIHAIDQVLIPQDINQLTQQG
ncbi:hypothetical protein ACF0H5_010921 [Mactra antiquata]